MEETIVALLARTLVRVQLGIGGVDLEASLDPYFLVKQAGVPCMAKHIDSSWPLA